MKKKLSSLLIFFMITLVSNAQDVPETAIKQGKAIITPYIGFPNLITTVIQNTYEATHREIEQLHVGSVGPFGINASYLITDHVAVGGEISYASTTIQWRENRTVEENDSIKFPFAIEFFTPFAH